jgi:hypothetical protein
MGRLPLLQLPQRGRWGGLVQVGVVGQLGQHRTRVGHGWGGCIVVGGAVARQGGMACRGAVCEGCVVWGRGWWVMSGLDLEGFVQR